MKPRKSTVTVVSMAIIAGLDIIGTPLAILAISSANSFSHKASAAVVKARTDDCEAAEKIRSRVRTKITQEKADLPKTLEALHVSASSPLVPKAEKNLQAELDSAAPVDCVKYGLEAKP